MFVNSDRRQKKADVQQQYDDIAEAACKRLSKNLRVRRNLPEGGRLRIDRQLPFLVVYRQPPDRRDLGTKKLVTTEAAYLCGCGGEDHHEGLMRLCSRVATTMQERFGSFLLIEIWADDHENQEADGRPPSLRIVSPDLNSIPSVIGAFRSALKQFTIRGQLARVDVQESHRIGADGLAPLEPAFTRSEQGQCCVIGLAVSPIYRPIAADSLYPIVLHRLRSSLAIALRKTIATFSQAEQPGRRKKTATYHELGPSSFVRAARLVDRQLCEVSESFDFLLQVTPTNGDEALTHFRDSGFRKLPRLTYRPLPYRPSTLKRQLFEIEIDRIEDPTLAHLFWEKQEELDRQLSALRDLGTPNFIHNSLQLYGTADDELLGLAHQILNRIPETETQADVRFIQGDQLVKCAQREIDYYRSKMSGFDATVEVLDGIAAGMMVSQDRLLLSSTSKVAASRLEALLHHEIGTHLLTYFNGCCQPFRQLYVGLSGYEELQEGLAVLAECLCGGMTSHRARTLAGRVIAVSSLTEGNSFAETFAMLRERFGFKEQRAFKICLRVYRGGGLTKDVIYLRGLNELLKYLAEGHELEPLYVGKIGLHHIPFVQEMRRRKMIVAPKILPRFWDGDAAENTLNDCRELSACQLLENKL